MYFNRIRHPANFVFATRSQPKSGRISIGGQQHRIAISDLGGDVHRLTLEHPRWGPHESQAELSPRIAGPSFHAVTLGRQGELAIVEKQSGRVCLRGEPSATFGLCGDAWLIQLRYEPQMHFFGLGEHSRGLEKGHQRLKFWNTDVVADFADAEVMNGYPIPAYVAIPWLIVKQGNEYLGILVHNPGAVFMDLASDFIWDGKNPEDRARRSFYVGAPGGSPELYLIVGPTLPELTRKLQTLVGRTPLPPLWALGHHQCRWGYAGPRDLRRLDRGFRAHRIPCDGLWLDIDYMDRYKVFTFSPQLWKKGTANLKRVLADLARQGRRVIPILDPGVKVQPGYAVCDDGCRQGMFCLNPAGTPFVGFVWPGQTYFPDFSLLKARQWWANQVKQFAALGFAGAWLDMNDPAVGAVEPEDMLFDRGRQPHTSYHNQYALGMARATRDGFLAARPDERPFLLSRSAFISSSRYTAVWTGDNASNWHHLRLAIPTSLSLALSGIPFNGPDVCGFARSTTPALAIAWYKAGFLFPFLRNHTTTGSRPQEPWALGAQARRVITHYIRLRYKLLPYLYQLFVAQEESGEAILRPLLYDFAEQPALPLAKTDDQFMVGPALMQAPVIEEGTLSRQVALPGDEGWFSAQTGTWLAGGRTVLARTTSQETPLFIREGALIPMLVGERRDQRSDLADIELHCFLQNNPNSAARTLRYVCDDGQSFAYRRGARSELTFSASADSAGVLNLSIQADTRAYRRVRVRAVVYAKFSRVSVTCGSLHQSLALRPYRWTFTGKLLSAQATRPFLVSAA